VVAYAVPAVPPGRDVVVIVSAGTTVTGSDFEALLFPLSVTVAVRVYDPAVVGVPLRAPPALSVSPAGTPLPVQLYPPPVPPLAARVVVAYAFPAIPLGTEVVVIVSAGTTVTANVFEDIFPPPSVTVTFS
jgi:hypothetical protein